MSIHAGTRQGYSRRGLQITESRVHMRSILSRLTGQYSNGQKSQWKVGDVRGLHGLK